MKPPSGEYVQYGCGMSCPDLWINFDASPRLRLQRLPIVGRAFQWGKIVFPKNVRYGDIIRAFPSRWFGRWRLRKSRS